MANNIVIRLQIFLYFHVDSLYKNSLFCLFVFFFGWFCVCYCCFFFLFSFSLFSDLIVTGSQREFPDSRDSIVIYYYSL